MEELQEPPKLNDDEEREDIPRDGDYELKSRVVYVHNLLPTISRSALWAVFHRFGDVEHVQIVRDRENTSDTDYAVIQFTHIGGAQEALSARIPDFGGMTVTKPQLVDRSATLGTHQLAANDTPTLFVTFRTQVSLPALRQIFCEFGVVTDISYIKGSRDRYMAAFVTFNSFDSVIAALAQKSTIQSQNIRLGLKIGSGRRNTSLTISGIKPGTSHKQIERVMSVFGDAVSGQTEVRHSVIAFVSFESRAGAERAREAAKLPSDVIPGDWNVRWTDWPTLSTHVRVEYAEDSLTGKKLRRAFSCWGVIHSFEFRSSHAVVGFESNQFGQFAAIEAAKVTQVGDVPVGCTLVRLRQSGHHSPTKENTLFDRPLVISPSKDVKGQVDLNFDKECRVNDAVLLRDSPQVLQSCYQVAVWPYEATTGALDGTRQPVHRFSHLQNQIYYAPVGVPVVPTSYHPGYAAPIVYGRPIIENGSFYE